MSLTKLEVFQMVVEVGSVSKAAEALGLTQSAVSHALASLEAEWGFSLLQRDRSGVRLTSNGEHMLKYVREVLHWHDQLKQQVAAINGLEIGTIRIGTFTSVSSQWLPSMIQTFRAAHPSIRMKWFEGDYDEIHHWIVNGIVDFGFLSLSASKALDTISLKKDPIICVVPMNHPFSAQQTVTLSQIEQEAFIMPKWGSDHDVRRILKENRITPNIQYEVVEEQAIMAMVECGLGISILPKMAIYRPSEHIRLIEIEGDHYRTIGIAATSFSHLSPAAKTFLRCLFKWLNERGMLDFPIERRLMLT